MNDSKKLTRRDWFRLRIPHQNKMLGETSGGKASDTIPATNETEVLKPIALPPNHDGLDLSELPPMREATISQEDVVALFSDIEKLATDILLMQRSTGATHASATKADSARKLGLAQESLLNGSVQRVQIRYRWDDTLWIDTLKSESNGFHVVRIAHRSI